MVIVHSSRNDELENDFSFQARPESRVLRCFTKYRYSDDFHIIEAHHILHFTGAWEMNPYLSFAVSALVELFAYILVHLILDRVGRKRPYCLFAILFGITAILVIPVQKYTTENGPGKHAARHLANASLTFF
jgi:MFS family permease